LFIIHHHDEQTIVHLLSLACEAAAMTSVRENARKMGNYILNKQKPKTNLKHLWRFCSLKKLLFIQRDAWNLKIEIATEQFFKSKNVANK
jgi:hypothetical protein